MKLNKPSSRRYKQGRYIPVNPQKIIGEVHEIVYRSGWEKQLMIQLDRADHVIRWGSEVFSIPYVSPKDNRPHQYFPDFIAITLDRNGNEVVTIIEVKPQSETRPPNNRGQKYFKKQCLTYEVNSAKWKYARAFCKSRGWQFIILTEKELGIRK